ncbi:hypothetical protein, partial [Rhodococcus jostii]|uniref:hypothetical protein n=1 Tax=Rhodococcus jostii TaxID=132919 RepID=UPI003645A03D
MSDEPNLAALIADRKGRRSYDRLSDDCGGTPSSGRLHQMATRTLKNFPDPDSIRGMANGLGVTVTDIVMASARSLGLSVYTGNDPSALSIGGAGDLPDSAKETLTTVAREFIKLTSQQDTDGAADDEEVQEPRTQESRSEQRSTGGNEEGPGAAMKPRRLSSAPDPDPTPAQLEELERVREEWKDRVKPHEWRLNDEGEVVDRHGMPPFKESEMLAAHRIPDELAGLYP